VDVIRARIEGEIPRINVTLKRHAAHKLVDTATTCRAAGMAPSHCRCHMGNRW